MLKLVSLFRCDGARRRAMLLSAAATVCWAGTARAQVSISVSGSPSAMKVTTAAAGSQPTPVTNAATTYKVTSLRTNQKITGQLNQSMPAGVTLTVALAAPGGGSTSVGAVPLSTTPANLVTGIGFVFNATRAITYQLSATVAAGVVPAASRTVTFTVLTGP